MAVDLNTAHRDLWKWCRSQGLAGYDPYDGLNSSLFQATPLRHSRAARLAWTQLFKRSPINLRKIAGVPAERNAKGIALFALAALADYRRLQTKEAEVTARELLDDLIGMSLKGFHGACWGYNFDWQSRSFFAPKGTPTIIPTAFAARALCEAAEVIDRDEYLPFARTICDFILNDLSRSDETSEEVCFSYSPLDQTRVYNASLMAAEVLATVGGMLREQSLCEGAMRATRYVVRRQLNDGSWAYGADGHQTWSDNFHTGFILTSLSRTMRMLAIAGPLSAGGEGEGGEVGRGLTPPQPLPTRGEGHGNLDLESALVRGFEFWKERFFLSNGWPQYYPNRLYPADVHSTAAAIVTLVELRGRFPGTLELAERIASWSIENMRSSDGYFYYQRHRFHMTRIPYMRWSQAWMAYALSRLLEVTH
ncbi:MAG: delta-aminolevulinic acid dehydratase [Pyrinomonadaceae bacterium]